jgi:glutamyl-tRNA reductase
VSGTLIALGVSHKTAPVELRERLALTEGSSTDFVRSLAVDEAVVISTCNRTELYVVSADPVAGEAAALGALARLADILPTELARGTVYSLRNCDAARHLYRVTAGLESMIVGEHEVQGQVRRAYESALDAGTTGPLTNRLFGAALAAGKRVRTETEVGHGTGSVSSAAVDLARQVLGELGERRVVILGAGETSELLARALAERGARTIFVANRHRDRAISLAERFGGEALGFDELPQELERADIVLSGTSSPHAIVGPEELEGIVEARGGRPLVLIDVAVPRDVDPDCAGLPGVSLYDIDDLQSVVARHMSLRADEARRAEALIEEEIERFARWLGTLEVLPTVAALRSRGQAIADAVLAENAGRWEGLSERDRERVDTMTRTVVNRLLHEPTVRLKRLEGDRAHARLQVLRELFALDEPAPAASAQDAREPAEVRELRRPR